MTRDEMKNKISLALKDPILQQGFECICKENAVLKDKIGMLDLFCGGDSFKQRRLDTFIQIANYIEKLEKENAELKKQLVMSNKVYNDNLDYSHHIEYQLAKAKESRSIQEEKLKLLSEYVSDLYVLGYSAKKIAELVQAKIADILGDKR